jgi:hypothetical protein
MSWTVVESWEGGSALQIEENGTGGTSSTNRVFTVTAPPVYSIQVVSAPGLPRPNDPHPAAPAMRARNYTVETIGPLYYQVTIEYIGKTPDPTDPSQNPLLLPPVISFGSVTQEVEIDEDVNGDPIQTVNGEPIVGVTRPFTDLIVIVERNIATFDPGVITGFTNKVGSAPWFGCPTGTTRIMDINARSQQGQDFPFWAATLSVQVRRGRGPVTDAKAWWHRTAHQGFIINDSGTKRIATTDDGQTVQQPVMLDLTTGAQLPAGTGAYIEFQVLETVDINDLNFL